LYLFLSPHKEREERERVAKRDGVEASSSALQFTVGEVTNEQAGGERERTEHRGELVLKPGQRKAGGGSRH
jgi:hypothetical protein